MTSRVGLRAYNMPQLHPLASNVPQSTGQHLPPLHILTHFTPPFPLGFYLTWSASFYFQPRRPFCPPLFLNRDRRLGAQPSLQPSIGTLNETYLYIEHFSQGRQTDIMAFWVYSGGHDMQSRINLDSLGQLYLIFAAVRTVPLLISIAFLLRNRKLPFLRVRKLPLGILAACTLHVYW